MTNSRRDGSRSTFRIDDWVELLDSRDPTAGRVVATRDEATWIYVLWLAGSGRVGKVTKEQPSDLRKARAAHAAPAVRR